MTGRYVALVPLLLAAFLTGGCEDEPYSSEPVTIKVTKDDNDESYEIQNTAEVSNEEWPLKEVEGMVVVQARDVGWDDNRTPMLQATVTQGDDSTVTCETHRSWLWSSQTEYMDLQMRCEGKIDLTDVKVVSVTSDY